MRSKGSRFTLGVWGLRVCSLDVAWLWSQPSATVRARTIWPCLWEVLQEGSFLAVSDVSLLRFAWQAWHFVTFSRVLERVESRFAWQAQYFCDVVRRCVAVFVAGAALWTRPSSFFVAGAALWTCRVACVLQIALAGLRQVATRCKFRGRRGILCEVLKIDGSLARNIDFEVANFQVLRKTRRKTLILKLQRVKIGGSLTRNARFGGSMVFLWPRRVNRGSCKTCPFVMLPTVKIAGSLVREMLVFLHPRVLSRVAGFPVASPCL